LDQVPPTDDDHRLAALLAEEAGSALVDLRARLVSQGAPARQLKDEGDRGSNAILLARLADARPDDAVLSEEAKDDGVRLERERVWIIDPLDGTREFSEPPRTDWAVHVALCLGGAPEVGAVALPALGLTLSTAEPPPVAPRRDAPPRIVVSRTRPPAESGRVQRALQADILEMGSAGAKCMAVVMGDADVYVHAGGQYEWDSAAPVAVALAAGLHASRLDGSPLTYNHPDPYLPDLVISRPELAQDVLAALS
jgi:3'(2'), 5'-bisphosphate nucleotidase